MSATLSAPSANAAVEITHGTEEAGDSGPAHIVVEDPDGNPILIDQFF